MASHHSQKFFNLHHDQVNAGKTRREQRQAERMQNFLATREQLCFEYNFPLVCGFICFAYTMFATATYLGYVIGA